MSGDAILAALGLAGRVALVTGGGSGMARATALLLAEAGAHVAIADLDLSAAEAVAAEIEERGVRSMAIATDVTDPEGPASAVAAAAAELGELGAAVNFAGGTAGVTKPFLDITVEEWGRPLALNLTSTLLSCQAEAVSMVRGGTGGAIVNVGSTSGITAAPNLAGYGAANAGVIQLTSTMALELAPYGIRVNCVVPGTHWTAGTRARALDPDAPPGVREFFDKAAAAAPLGRLGEPGETAGAALFLASQLSSYITGHRVVSDGGVLHTTARPAFGAQEHPAALRDVLAERQER